MVDPGDQRERHVGVSHHSRTVLELCRAPTTVAVAQPTDIPAPHLVEEVMPGDVGELLSRHGLRVTTMGRGPHQDPSFFAAAGAAGALAAAWVGPARSR